MDIKKLVKILFALLVALTVVLGVVYAVDQLNQMHNAIGNGPIVPGVTPVACTMEAKLCPDGSYVGRTGPNCEFAACPTSVVPTTKSGILTGTVTLGPTCPVERIPPDPACAPRPFQGTVNALDANSRIVATTKSDAAGNFTFKLSPGSYEIEANGGNPYPRCSPETVVIKAGVASSISLSCDTGIR